MSGEMHTTDRLNRKVQLAFGSALLTLALVGAVSYRGLAASSESERWVRHTHDVLAVLQDLGFTPEEHRIKQPRICAGGEKPISSPAAPAC